MLGPPFQKGNLEDLASKKLVIQTVNEESNETVLQIEMAFWAWRAASFEARSSRWRKVFGSGRPEGRFLRC